MTDLTPQDLNPFRAAPDPDAPDDRSRPADVSQAGMSRLRTPFSTDDEAGREPHPPASAG